MTVLYDLQQNIVLSTHNPRYLVDNKPVQLEYPVVELQYIPSNPPDYDYNLQKAISEWILTSDSYMEQWTVVDLTDQELEDLRISRIPREITRRQLKLGMITILNLPPSVVDDMINQIPDSTDKLITTILWEESGTFEITHPLVQQFASSLGLTQRQLEDFFTEAGKL